MREYRIVDADQHIIEPVDLWEKWLPAKFRERAPRLVKDEDGGDAWQLGKNIEPLGLVTVMGTRPRDLRWTGVRYADVHPGCYEPNARLELMDEDSIDATVIFPPQRTMAYFMSNVDADFHLAGIEAYNNWVIDAFCAACPERLGAIGQIPSALGVAASIKEARRLKDKGVRGLTINTWPSGGPTLRPEDDSFWAVVEELGLSVHLHIALAVAGAPRPRIGVKAGGPSQLIRLATTLSAMPGLIAETIFTGMLDRFPKLRLVGAEVGAGWVPYFLGEMDDRYRRNRYWTKVSLERLPSEYFARNWTVGFVRDPYGVANRHAVGIGNMMWASDFPHHINDWPNSRWLINEMSPGVPEDEKRKLFCENAGRIYGFIR
jgi:predicted TIM-barrel fold metal-dependent hydrolase